MHKYIHLLCVGCYACFCAPCFLSNLHARTSEYPCMWCFPGGKQKNKSDEMMNLFIIFKVIQHYEQKCEQASESVYVLTYF